MIKQLLLVGIGGAGGSILRFLTSYFTARYYHAVFPLATFITNIMGCFVIGMLIAWLGPVPQENQNLRLLLITGFCGGYTTFSAFAAENITLLQSQNLFTAIVYITASVVAGLIAVWAGLHIGTWK